MKYDVAIVGASFAGLTLALHLPKEYKILIIDRKTSLDQHIESTGLITQDTKDLIDEFFDTTPFIPNKITTIAVVGTNFEDHFFSHTDSPWIYSTDTPALIKAMSEKLPPNVTLKLNTPLTDIDQLPAKFIVGADGAKSTLARLSPHLDQNKKHLTGLEKVFYGNINLGPNPESTIYHFWFGDFSLGYGGWLSPTVHNNKPAFRLGLAKHLKDTKELTKIYDFIETLKEKNIITIEPGTKEILSFASHIPINGLVKRFQHKNTLLIGDAAGYCGAFAADGIKGAVLSAQTAAKLIPQHLNGTPNAFKHFHKHIQSHNRLITYYKKQLLYRFLWDRMKSNRSFDTLHALVKKDKENFLNQFCDSKDNNKSLMSSLLKIKNIPHLSKYSIYLLLDLFK